VEQISSPSQFGYYEKLIVNAKHIIQPNDIIMPPQLSQNIYLLLQFGDIFRITPEENALTRKLLSFSRFGRGVSFRFPTRGDADLAVGTFANHKVTV
jgi:hypothetical protein